MPNFKPRNITTEADLMQYFANMGKVRGSVCGLREREQSRPIIPADTPGVRKNVRAPAVAGAGSNPAPSPYKSNLEQAWAHHLDVLKAATVIDGWTYEPINFRLPGRKNFYKIDFLAWSGRAVTFYEIKGRNKSDDRSLVKLKTATGLHPWARFIQVKRVHGEWVERVMA